MGTIGCWCFVAATLMAITAFAASDQKVGSTGFWHLEKTDTGTWWFVDPNQDRQFMLCVTTVRPILHGRGTGDKKWDYIAEGIDPANLTDQSLRAWADKTAAQIKSIGFKGIGAWSDPIFHQCDIPTSRDLNLWLTAGWPKYQDYLMYDPGWSAKLDAVLTTVVDPLRDNKNLIGYYLDSELRWDEQAVGASKYFSQPLDSPQRREVCNLIRQIWPDARAFNSQWQTDIANLTEIQTWKALPANCTGREQLDGAWRAHVADDYFRMTTEAVRRHDPNHLLLGVKFHARVPKAKTDCWCPDEAIQAAAKYFDANSLDYYPDADATVPGIELNAFRATGKPTIISEYSMHALENRSFDMNTAGYPFVKTQIDRAAVFTKFTQAIAARPEVIGADWFQWTDQPPSGREGDGEDVNFGVVDLFGKPYPPLVEQIASVAPKLNALHASR